MKLIMLVLAAIFLTACTASGQQPRPAEDATKLSQQELNAADEPVHIYQRYVGTGKVTVSEELNYNARVRAAEKRSRRQAAMFMLRDILRGYSNYVAKHYDFTFNSTAEEVDMYSGITMQLFGSDQRVVVANDGDVTVTTVIDYPTYRAHLENLQHTALDPMHPNAFQAYIQALINKEKSQK